MKRRLLAMLGLLLIATLVLAACGGGEPTPAPAAPAEAPAATEAPAAPAEAAPTEAPAAEAAPTEAAAEEAAPAAEGVVTINFLGDSAGSGSDFRRTRIAEWNAANPDIQIQLIESPKSATDFYGQLLQTFQAQSSDIDVMMIDVIWPGDLAEHLVDLNQYGGAEVAAAQFPAIVTNNTVDGALVGLPWYTDGGLMYYRTDLLEKYGYAGPPKTWAELEEMATTIQEGERAEGNQDFWGYVWQGLAYEGLTCNALEWVYSDGGGTIVSPDKMITINNEAAAASLDQAYSWIGTISPPGVTGFKEEESRAVWMGGNAAFMRNWPYAYGLGNADDSAIKGKFDAGPLPGASEGQSAATLGGWQIAVSKYSKNIDAAAKVALWLVSVEEQKANAIGNSLIPTNMSLYEDPEVVAAQPFMAQLLPVFTSAVARPSTATAPKYNEVSTIFFQNVSDVLTGKQSGADAVANIELDLEDLLGFEVGQP